jgi:hypothetical protein
MLRPWRRRQGRPSAWRELRTGLFPTSCCGWWAVDGAVGNFVGGEGTVGGDGEGCLEQDVGLVPVDVVLDVDLVALKADGLYELGVLPMTCNPDRWIRAPVQ